SHRRPGKTLVASRRCWAIGTPRQRPLATFAEWSTRWMRSGLSIAPARRASTPLPSSSLPTRANGPMNRSDAFALLTEYVKDQSLVRHCLSVEAAMRAYARKLGQDEEKWGV